MVNFTIHIEPTTNGYTLASIYTFTYSRALDYHVYSGLKFLKGFTSNLGAIHAALAYADMVSNQYVIPVKNGYKCYI